MVHREGLNTDQNSGGEGVGESMRKDLVSNPTNLGFNTSLAIDQLCDLELQQVKSVFYTS